MGSKVTMESSTPSVDTEPSRSPATRTRPQRPNYKHIHRYPLPLTVHPLPPLIPHNPLSVISVLLSYLTLLISPPQREIYSAYFDPATSSVHVTDEKAIKALWEMGFFGKGSLSRSEPSWLAREKKRRGLLGERTSEEVTRRRRVERREMKLERARKEKEVVDQRLKAEAAAKRGDLGQLELDAPSLSANEATNGFLNGSVHGSAHHNTDPVDLETKVAQSETDVNRTTCSPEKRSPNGTKTVRFSPIIEEKKLISDSEINTLNRQQAIRSEEDSEEPIVNEEHLQLSNEETFFLVYGLGVVRVFDGPDASVLSTTSLLQLFCQHTNFPPHQASDAVQPDNEFLVSYVVYHHFRSLGWVVRSGVKFGVDYLLYNRGPVFAHAEFAVVILPSYEHSYWSATPERRDQAAQKESRSWWWLHGVNRVQAQVKKTLVLCFVEIPPPSVTSSLDHIGSILRQYKVREVIVRRWIPNRSRD